MTAAATFEFAPERLPATRGVRGPATVRLQRRTLGIWLAMAGLGALPMALGAAPGWQAAGLGLWFPGAGFIALGNGWSLLVVPTLVLFLASLVAWFWAGAVVAPLGVWLGAAALAGGLAGPAPIWPGAPFANAALILAVALALRARHRKAARAGAEIARTREAMLPVSLAEVAEMQAVTPDPAARELTPDQIARLRYLLDRTLQPIESFDGFTIIDQFQPAALRYQINHMGFALAVAQASCLPSFQGYMRTAQTNLIAKYLDRRVWDYWVLESCWGHLNFTDWDPARRDNIMLTGWFAAHVGGYMLASGDTRYLEPGSLTFRLNDRQAWPHDFRSLVASIDSNYRTAEFGIYACEPNWIYPICNHYGMLALATHDALLQGDLVQHHLPAWLHGIETEFTDAAGSTIGLRSQYTGLPVPFPVTEAGYSFFESAFLPARARQQWAIARRELEPLLAQDDAGEWLALPGEGLDAGHYRPGHGGSLSSILVAAREFGDTRIADAAMAALDRLCMPALDDGVHRYRKASNITNATAVLGALMQTGDFARTFTRGAPASCRTGPTIEATSYPEVLVARAWSDGTGLEAVFYPGREDGVQTIPLSNLRPGARYQAVGAMAPELCADDQGRGAVSVMLSGRTTLSLRPV